MEIFTLLSIILVVTMLITGVLRLFKQPIVIGYIVSGLVLENLIFSAYKIHATEIYEVFSQLGIATLLFIVGLHLSPTEVRSFGKSAFIIGISQVFFTFTLGFILSLLLSFSLVSSIYIGFALTFSSTIVVLKFLSDKRDLEKLYGRISIGVLLLQDVVAALVLIGAVAFSSDTSGLNVFILLIIKGIAATIVLSIISRYLLPRLSTFFAMSGEYLLLFSLAWGFGLATVFRYLGFSLEIGALVAGVVLAVSPYGSEISSRLKPIRDFFVILFFVSLGSQVALESIGNLILPVLIFSAFIVLIKPLIVIAISGLLRYNSKIGFLAGTSLAQISEFSLILALLGYRAGAFGEDVLSIITLLGIISIATSTYIIKYAERLYILLLPSLRFFSRKKVRSEIQTLSGYDVILFGCNRVGFDFIEVFKKLETKFLAVDFDPDVVKKLTDDSINIKYGDAEDGEFLDDIGASDAKMIISTIPDHETNLFLVNKLRAESSAVQIVLLSTSVADALDLYKRGANYVIVPHFIGGQYVSRLVKDALFGAHNLDQTRISQIEYLENRKSLGHAKIFS